MHPKFVQAIERTNDTVIYTGIAYHTVSCDDEEELKKSIAKEPFSACTVCVKPFAEIFKEVNCDLYKIDPGLFAPAIFVVNNIKTGKTFRAGKMDVKVFEKCTKLQTL